MGGSEIRAEAPPQKKCCHIEYRTETRTKQVPRVVFQTVIVKGRPQLVKKVVYETVQYTVIVPVLVCDDPK